MILQIHTKMDTTEKQITYELNLSEFDPDANDYEIDMSFLQKLRKVEVVPGITKYEMKVPADTPIVEPDSHVKVMKQHRNREGELVKANNPNFCTPYKFKLASPNNDQEMIACLRTMKLEEISFFFIDREILDKNAPNPEYLSEADKKKLQKENLLDGCYRFHLVTEEKIKKPSQPGLKKTQELALEEVKAFKTKGNELFIQKLYLKASREYMKGINSAGCFPKPLADAEQKTEILESLNKVRSDMINNCLKAIYHIILAQEGEFKHCEKLFLKEIINEFHLNCKFVTSMAQIWELLSKNDSSTLDVAEMIEYLQDFLEKPIEIPESDKIIVNRVLKQLKRYEKQYNVLSRLSNYTEQAEEFEKKQKILERMKEKEEEELNRLQEDIEEMVEDTEAQETDPSTPIEENTQMREIISTQDTHS